MDKKILKAEVRKLEGRKVKQLRKTGIIPMNIFGKGVKSVSLQAASDDFDKIYKQVGETGLVEVIFGKETRPVLIHNVQMDPVSDKALHADLLQVDLKQKVTAEVKVELVGESPAEKQGLGTVVLLLNELEVEALPADLPEKFEIDVTKLTEVDQAVYIKNIKTGSKVAMLGNADEIVAKVEPLQKVEEPVVVAPVEGEVAAPVEGETPKPGASAEATAPKAEEGPQS